MSASINNTSVDNKNYGTKVAVVLTVSLIFLALIQNIIVNNQKDDLSELSVAINNRSKPPINPVDKIKLQKPNAKQKLVTYLNNNPKYTSPDSRTDNKLKLDKRQLIIWVNNNQYAKARHYLIKVASKAVDQKNNVLLGEVIQLLGRVAATQGDLASTEVYLFEALNIFKQTGNTPQVADTHLLIGQMYAKRRYLAQQAGWAYGDLLMARFYLSKGENYAARQALDVSIGANLKLGRTGAVASAYKTMARYYRLVSDLNGESNALVEAGKYYAHSGQEYQARKILDQLRQRQTSLGVVQALESQISSRLERYESQINLVRQARDYMRLYSLYKSKGKAGRAWEFRVKASEILSRTKKRDMYFRSPDVMAVLYDSNFNYDRAKNYLSFAAKSYLEHNNLKAYNQVAAIKANLL